MPPFHVELPGKVVRTPEENPEDAPSLAQLSPACHQWEELPPMLARAACTNRL